MFQKVDIFETFVAVPPLETVSPFVFSSKFTEDGRGGFWKDLAGCILKKRIGNNLFTVELAWEPIVCPPLSLLCDNPLGENKGRQKKKPEIRTSLRRIATLPWQISYDKSSLIILVSTTIANCQALALPANRENLPRTYCVKPDNDQNSVDVQRRTYIDLCSDVYLCSHVSTSPQCRKIEAATALYLY